MLPHPHHTGHSRTRACAPGTPERDSVPVASPAPFRRCLWPRRPGWWVRAPRPRRPTLRQPQRRTAPRPARRCPGAVPVPIPAPAAARLRTAVGPRPAGCSLAPRPLRAVAQALRHRRKLCLGEAALGRRRRRQGPRRLTARVSIFTPPAPGLPWRPPTQVPTRPGPAWLPRSDGVGLVPGAAAADTAENLTVSDCRTLASSTVPSSERRLRSSLLTGVRLRTGPSPPGAPSGAPPVLSPRPPPAVYLLATRAVHAVASVSLA